MYNNPNFRRKPTIGDTLLKIAMVLFFGALATVACVQLFGCTEVDVKPDGAKPAVTTTTAAPPASNFKVSWEKVAGASEWTRYTSDIIGNELFASFENATDVATFCPKYKSLAKPAKVLFWTEFVSAVAYYESAWKPTSRMVETTMDIDPVTGKQVVSEGLLQLSYQDQKSYPFCVFDWEKDRKLAATDAAKSILKPIPNLNCGVRIMARIAKNRGLVAPKTNPYWAVLVPGGKHTQVAGIAAMTKKVPGCN